MDFSSGINLLISFAGFLVSVIGAIIAVSTMIGRYKEKVDSLKERICEAEKELKELRSHMDTIKEFKIQAQKFIDRGLYTANSPLSLTEFGKKLVKESGFESIFYVVRDDLLQKLEKLGPQSKYDTQELARSLMDRLDDYAAFDTIKTYAYNTGTDYNQILRAGSILLRDYYLEKHPEIQK